MQVSTLPVSKTIIRLQFLRKVRSKQGRPSLDTDYHKWAGKSKLPAGILLMFGVTSQWNYFWYMNINASFVRLGHRMQHGAGHFLVLSETSLHFQEEMSMLFSSFKLLVLVKLLWKQMMHCKLLLSTPEKNPKSKSYTTLDQPLRRQTWNAVVFSW